MSCPQSTPTNTTLHQHYAACIERERAADARCRAADAERAIAGSRPDIERRCREADDAWAVACDARLDAEAALLAARIETPADVVAKARIIAHLAASFEVADQIGEFAEQMAAFAERRVAA